MFGSEAVLRLCWCIQLQLPSQLCFFFSCELACFSQYGSQINRVFLCIINLLTFDLLAGKSAFPRGNPCKNHLDKKRYRQQKGSMILATLGLGRTAPADLPP